VSAQKQHVVLCGYRDWALNAFSRIESVADAAMWNVDFFTAKSSQELDRHLDTLARLRSSGSCELPDDVLFCAGWSWIIPRKTVEGNLCVGMHPSDLPAFAGGSPIQHQILQGVRSTKATLFRMRPQLDAGEIVCKSDMSLEGHMADVFKELERVTVDLFVRFWSARREDRLAFTPQRAGDVPLKRLRPEDSDVTWRLQCHEHAGSHLPFRVRDLWDHVRCREDPYPNAYVEDETGRLMFKRVEFEPVRSST
jgi:methionyl-tRNA formyltransferase